MRNLKKVLALTLVLALSLSMVITAGAAQFSDVKDTDANAAAYSLLADLKIAQGYDDGTFQPDTNLTRETAVTFIFRMATGQANADYMKGTTQFKDVAADRWSAGYINWASEKNIVQGDPDGNFAPSRTVSVAELSKMMVVAMGYDVKNYNFPWGFVDKAQDLGLLNGLLNQSANTPATRGMTSVVIKNGLFSSGRIEIVGNNVTNLASFATTRFGIVSTTARLEGTSNLVGASGITALNKVAFSGGIVSTFSGNVDALFGRNVTIWYKDTGSTVDSFDNTDTVVSIVAKGGDKVVSANASAIASDNTVKIDGTTYTFPASGAVASLNYGASGNVTYNQNNNAIVYAVSDGSNTTFNYVYAVEASVAKISAITTAGAVSATAVAPDTVALSAVAKEQIKAYDGIAKDDYVYVYPTKTVYTNSSSVVTTGTVYNLVKANTLANVQVTGLSTSSVYTIGGTGYKLATVAGGSTGAPTLGNNYDVVVSPTGFAFAFTGVSASTSTVYGVVIDVAAQLSADGTYKNRSVTVVKGDGSSAVYNAVDATAFGPSGAYTTAAYGWKTTSGIADIFRKPVVLTLNADGKVTAIADVTTTTGTVAYNSSTGIVTGTGAVSGSYTLTANTVVFYIPSTGAIKAYQGAAIPTFAATAVTGFMYDSTSSLSPVKAIVVSASLSTTSADEDGYYQYTGQVYEGGTAYYTYKISYKGEVKTVNATTTHGASIGTSATPAYGKLTVDSNGRLTGVASATTGFTGARTLLSARADNVVNIGGTLYTLASDAKVVLLETTAAGVYVNITSMGTLDDVVANKYVDFVASSGKISFIAVYVDTTLAAAADADIADALALVTNITVSETASEDNLLDKLNAVTGMSATGVTLSVTASADEDVIDLDGDVDYTGGDTTVVVTISIAKTNGTTLTKDITVTVDAT